MISYDRTDKSKGIDFNKTGNSIKCMICNYWDFKDIEFKYQPYVCNGCHDLSMGVQNLSDFLILSIRNVDCRVYIVSIDKKTAINISVNSVLSDRGVV